MINQIINLANDNQGVIAIFGVILTAAGSLVGYFLFNKRRRKTLIQKQKGGDSSKNYQAGGDINIQK